MKRKDILLFVATPIMACFLTGCGQEVIPETQSDLEKNQDCFESMDNFAIVLSKAVANEPSLRNFVKQTALEEFDKDYDVFYPFVKNSIVDGSHSFENLLQLYCEDGKTIESIISGISKPTILVPDFSWVSDNCFSVKHWDTSNNQVAVAVEKNNGIHTIYYDGEVVGHLSDEEYPSFPVLIIKSNERMVELAPTKSGVIEYDFANKFFDNAQTKVRTWEGDFYNETENISSKRDLVSEVGYRISESDLNNICPDAITAYREFGTGMVNGVQRDYLYYGLTCENNTSGVMNPNRRDMIYRMKISPEKLFNSMDDDTEDPLTVLGTGRGDRPTFDGAVSRMWSNGNLEIQIEFFKGIKDGGTDEIDKILLSIYPGDLMYLTKCHDVFQWNIFGNNWSVYTIKKEDIQPKWYYPGDEGHVVLIQSPWDLNYRSQNIWFKSSEIDKEKTYTKNMTVGFKFSSSMSTQSGDSVKMTTTIGNEHSESHSETVTYTESPDDLGSAFIEYADSYIASNNYDGTYNLGYVSTYSFEFSLLPINLSDKYRIRDYMLQRKKQ